MTAPEPVSRGVPRPLLLTLFVGIAVAMVFLLPGRDDGAPVPSAADPLAPALLRLELDEPPAWALQRGQDEVQRNLDRLAWGGPMALRASFEVLERHGGQLAPVLLSRLRAVGATDPVMASKLVVLLGGEDPDEPGVMDELLRRAVSESALEAQSALRVLAMTDHPRSVDGIVPRLMDPDETVREFARSALARRARDGDETARGYVLAELRLEPATPDPTYLGVLDHLGDGEQVTELLREIERTAPELTAFIARTALVRRGDPEAVAAFEDMLASDDAYARVNALHALVLVQVVLGWDHWATIARRGEPEEVLPLAGILLRAIDIGHPRALEASQLLEGLAGDRTNGVHVEITDRLYNRRHPWAVEATREELRTLTGGLLSETVDRVIDGAPEEAEEMAEVALARLQAGGARPDENALLLRLLAHVAPETVIDRIVQEALDTASTVRGEMPTLLVRAGPVALRRLERELGDPRIDALFVRVAGDVGSSEALDGLQRLLSSDATDPVVRRAALDCLALLRDGPRADVLRDAVDRFKDPAFAARARLVYWNYL